MKFYINKKIIEKFKNENINVDYIGTVIIILTSLYQQNLDILDNLDDNNKSKRLLLLYRYLTRKELLESLDDNYILYGLTEKGREFTKFLLSFEEDEMEVHGEMINEVLELEEEDLNVWIKEWLNLFPSERFYGRSLKTNVKDCLERMKWFKSQYDYSKEQIIQATKNYIENQRTSPDGHKFTRNSTYFICKGRGTVDRTSDLASECEKLKDEKSVTKLEFDRDSA